MDSGITGGKIIEIADFEDPALDVYARLTEAQLLHIDEPGEGLFVAESPLVIGRALQAGYLPVSALVERRQLGSGEAQEVLKACGQLVPGFPIYTAAFDVLTRLTGFALTRGMLCAMRRRPLPPVQELCRDARRIAVLENVENPTNVGAIIRSAAALSMDAVLLTRGCSNPLYRRAARVSMGTVFQVPWTFFPKGCRWPQEGCALLQEMGFQTAAMALRDDAVALGDPQLRQAERLAIVLGAEGDGLLADTIARCDYTVRIPMSHGVDSLNVAAASAVAFWELGKG